MSGDWRTTFLTFNFFLSLYFPFLTGSCYECTVPWYLFEPTQSCYLMVDFDDNWFAIRDHCNSEGGQLASIQSSEENEFIRQKIRYTNGMEYYNFIGFSRDAPDNWEWVNGEVVNYTNWKSREPNSDSTTSCAMMSKYSGEWRDSPCYNERTAVCKKDAARVTCAPNLSSSIQVGDISTESTFAIASDSYIYVSSSETTSNSSTIISIATSPASPPITYGPSITSPDQATSNSSDMIQILDPVSTDDALIDCSDNDFINLKRLKYGKSSSVYKSGSVLIFSCDPGYVFPDGSKVRSLVCLPSGRWSTAISSCERQSCSEIPDIMNSRKVVIADERVVVHCSDGHRSTSGRHIQEAECSLQGSWTQPLTHCESPRCPPLPLVPHSRAPPHTVLPASSLLLPCAEHYRLSDGTQMQNITCDGSSASWKPLGLDSCQLERCLPLPELSNASVSTLLTEVGTTVTISCKQGHKLPDNTFSREIECQPNKTWSRPPDDCFAISCSSPPTVTMATMDGNGTGLNDTWFYRCFPDRRFADGEVIKVLTCREFGSWDPLPPLFDCQYGRCHPVPRVLNAIASNNLAINNSDVRYTCLPGHHISENITSFTVSCQNGTWNLSEEATPSCSRIPCPPVPVMNNAKPLEVRSDYWYGDTRSFFCHDGYQINNSSNFSLSCSSEGEWQPTINDGCIPIQCEDIPEYPNTWPDALTGLYGEKITMKCYHGYTFRSGINVLALVCGDDGKWNPPPEKCTVIRCPSLALFDNILMSSAETRYGTRTNISCSKQTRFSNTNFTNIQVYCGEDGSWNPAVPKCLGDEEDKVIEPVEGPSARVIGTGVVGIMIFVASFIVLLDIITLGKDINAIRRNFHFVKRIIHICRDKLGWRGTSDVTVSRMSREFQGININDRQIRIIDVE